MPIPKPNKDQTDPTNYRPIALTSCICKTMERMINDRLTWFLEANNIITDYQSGFRRHRSTNDHLLQIKRKLPIHPSLELNFKSCHLNIQIFSIYTQTVEKTDRTLHQPVYLGLTFENAVYLIMHPYSQQKSKPLI